MPQTEGAQGNVEALIWKLERFRVADLKIGPANLRAGDLDHSRCEIDPGDASPARRNRASEVTGASADIEHVAPCNVTHILENGFNGLVRYRCEVCVIGRCLLSPAGLFKGLE